MDFYTNQKIEERISITAMEPQPLTKKRKRIIDSSGSEEDDVELPPKSLFRTFPELTCQSVQLGSYGPLKGTRSRKSC